ncbi:MATE family efflux transporter [Psychrobium sp. 1_MG-2023]|uniref:MATE family efflux transporter n=1 Tax=Psychrobium sp. 1_MG-2023 TaxID=3062624 RepID=UPI000C338C18|nr:MATE family efflux transporter [Psychrobium sp. 1_MG-2023]MDP2562702.1 MATE family efflux transporter [Psychrobium sp. 1_MG-2023]PKF54034.1 MATE family efflux transporter [Alteromonadales bacterium alter-6D02]
MNSTALLTAPVNSTLKSMTVPMTYGLILMMSFNIVDTFFVSMLGTTSLAAFSFTFPVTFTLISLAIGMGVGVSAVVAKTLGQDNKELARQHASVALIVSAILIYGLAMVGVWLHDVIFSAMGASTKEIELISLYMSPWLFGCLILIMPMIGNSVMRASGDTKTPAKVMGIGAIINAILDPIFIFGAGPIEPMGLQGAAIASILASFVCCVIVFYRLTISYQMLGWGYRLNQVIDSSKKLLAIGLPAAASNMMTPISSSILTAIVATYGSEAVAAFGVGGRIESFAVIVVLALSMSLPPFISQNFGAGHYQRVKQGYFSSIKFVMLWQAAIYLILALSSGYIARLFATDPQVIEIITLYLLIMPLTHGFAGITILSNSSLNALHKPMISIGLNIIRLFILMLPLAFFGGYLGEVTGLIIGVAIAGGLTGLIAFVIMRFHLHQLAGNTNLSSQSNHDIALENSK